MVRTHLTFLSVALSLCIASAATGEEVSTSPEQVISELVAGNKRFTEGKSTHYHQDASRRAEVANGQKPIAAILSCADSRVPPEVVFDRGLGDLFVVRVAGHVLDDTALASLEYAVEHLGIKVIMVLGHERCGAVTAAVKGGHLPGHLAVLVEKIHPVVKNASAENAADIDRCINDNARYVAKQLRDAKPIVGEAASSGMIKIVAGRYDLDTGSVELLPF